MQITIDMCNLKRYGRKEEMRGGVSDEKYLWP